MKDTTESMNKSLGAPKIISIDEGEIRNHLGEMVRKSVEDTLNSLLDAEADALCNAARYERSPDRTDTRAGHYTRQLHTKAGEVTLKVPKLRKLTFETSIIGLPEQFIMNSLNQNTVTFCGRKIFWK